jgi:hypothetical protein
VAEETPRSSFRLKTRTIQEIELIARWNGGMTKTRVIEKAVQALAETVPRWFKELDDKRQKQQAEL